MGRDCRPAALIAALENQFPAAAQPILIQDAEPLMSLSAQTTKTTSFEVFICPGATGAAWLVLISEAATLPPAAEELP